MCAIFELVEGFTLPYPLLENAVYNNMHGYGVVLIDGNNKIHVKKELPEKGNDPEVIYKYLKDNEDTRRYVHLRHRTEGDISEANVQPFCVFSNSRRTTYFMHNGTMSHPWNKVETPESPYHGFSDTKKFADILLTPKLQKFVGEKGKGDYSDPDIMEVLEKFWPHGNRGLLVSNDLPPLLMGTWVDIKTKVDDKEFTFRASNDSYFKEVVRGPIFEERKKKLLADMEKNQKGGREIVSIEDHRRLLDLRSFSKRFGLQGVVDNLLQDYNMYDAEGYISLAGLSYAEIEKFCERNTVGDTALMMMYVLRYLREETQLRIEKENEVLDLTNKLEEAYTELDEEVDENEDQAA